jgi:hypothetical protein
VKDRRVHSVAILAASLLLLTGLGTFVAGGKLTLLSAFALSLGMVSWTALRNPGALVARGALAGVSLLLIAAVPVDVRFSASDHAGVGVGPAIWGPMTPGTVASAPPHAVFMGRCLLPSHATRYVIAVSF